MYEYEKRKLRKYLGNDLYNTFKKYNCIIAGGSILSIFNNTEINDVDLYFRSANDMSDFLHNEMEGTWIIAHTKKAFLFKCDSVKIQTIYFKYFNSPEEIFDTFDFTVCMAAFDFKSEKFVLHEDFLRHNVSKILKFNERTAYPIVSALRVTKYRNKGFSISKPEYIKILLTILSLRIDNYDDLKEQMGGMYGENYDSLLEPKAGEAFDISSIIENLGRLGETDYDYKLNACNTEISDFDSFVCGVTGLKMKYFVHEDKCYRFKDGNIEEVGIHDIDADWYEKCDMNQVVKFPLTLYKYVNQADDGRIYSFYDKNYEWVIGENKPKREDTGLFACESGELKNTIYAGEKTAVCLEVECESFDDVIVDYKPWRSENTYKRLIGKRLVPVDELKKMNIIKNDDDDISIWE